MKALTQYVMSGRRQSIIAAVLLGLLPILNYLSAPVVALVLLRHGKSEAMIVLVWAILPAVAWAVAGDFIPLLLMLGITVLAQVLRSTGSWEVTLLASIGVGIGAQLGLLINPNVLVVMEGQLTTLMEQLVASSPELQGQVTLAEPEVLRQMLLMFIGITVSFSAVTLLMLARSWQARLFNPGGFREEFHQLRLSWKSSAVLFLMFMLATIGPPVLQQLSLFFVLPLLIAGIALVHGLVGRRKLPVAVLVIFYSVLMSPVMAQLVVLAAVADSWIDFRSKVAQRD